MTSVAQEIIQELEKLDNDRQQEVLAFVRKLSTSKGSLSARDLLKLSVKERQKYVRDAFQAAENEDFETFEAYSEETLSD